MSQNRPPCYAPVSSTEDAVSKLFMPEAASAMPPPPAGCSSPLALISGITC